MNTTIRRPGLVAGLALLMSLVLVLPVSAGQDFGSPPPPLDVVVPYDLGSGPIKVSVTEPSATGDSESVTIDFSIAGIPEPALLSPWQNNLGNWDFGRNETGISLLGPDKTPLDLEVIPELLLPSITDSYFGLRTVFVSPFSLPYLIVAGEKVRLERLCFAYFNSYQPVENVIGTVVDWGDGGPKTTITNVVPDAPDPVTCAPQGEHIYKQAGDYRVKMSGNNILDGTWAQSFPITVLPSRSNLTAQLAPLLADLSSFDGSGAITGKLTLNRSGSAWIVQDLTMVSPDGRVWAKPIAAGYVPNYRPLQDGETFYLSVIVQSNGEDCSAVVWPDEGPPDPKDAKADANGYVPCGAYNVIAPISVPAAPVASTSPSVSPATPTPSASPVVTPTDQGGPVSPLLGLGALLFLALVLFIAFRRRRRRDGDRKVV